MSSYHQQRETRSRIIFTVLIIAVTVGITYGLIRLTLPSLTGQTTTTKNDSTSQTAEKQEEEKDLPRGDAKRVADLDRLAAALKTYKEQHGGYPISTGTCAGGSFDSDADLGFLADLEREAVIDAIPRDPAGIAKTTKTAQGTDAASSEDCDTMYGAKHYLHYSNGTKFALIASVDDADAIPDDAAGVYLAEGDREWFDGSALITDWHWSRNVYIVSNQKLAEAAKKYHRRIMPQRGSREKKPSTHPLTARPRSFGHVKGGIRPSQSAYLSSSVGCRQGHNRPVSRLETGHLSGSACVEEAPRQIRPSR